MIIISPFFPSEKALSVTRISSVRKERERAQLIWGIIMGLRELRYNFARIQSRIINSRYGFRFFPEDLETVLSSL